MTGAAGAPSPPAGGSGPAGKPALSQEELADVVDLALWAGQLLLQYGARTQRVEETVHHLGTGLGCDWLDILVSPNAIVLTTTSGGSFRTKIRRVVRVGVNMSGVVAINEISRAVAARRLDRQAVRAALERVATAPPHYHRWVVVGMVGLACAALSRLFGGDWPVFGVTLFAAGLAMWLRQELARRAFNPLLVVMATAFAAGVGASLATLWRLSDQPQTALAASVLLLVPGVPLITAAQDLIEGHLVTGLARALTGTLISLSIAVGLLLAMWLMGVGGL